SIMNRQQHKRCNRKLRASDRNILEELQQDDAGGNRKDERRKSRGQTPVVPDEQKRKLREIAQRRRVGCLSNPTNHAAPGKMPRRQGLQNFGNTERQYEIGG